MKKRIRILFPLCLAVLLALTACSGSPARTADGTYVKPVEPAEAPADKTTSVPADTQAPAPFEPGPGPDTAAAPSEVPAQSAPAPESAAPPSVIATGFAPGEGPSDRTEDPSAETPEDPSAPADSSEQPEDPSAEPPEETLSPETPGTFTAEDLLFTYKGKTIEVDAPFVYTDFEEAWGSPRVEKAQACIGGGFDENYYFGTHLAVSTLGDTGVQVIYDIFIDEAGFTTAKGAEIGRTDRDALHRIYGEPEGSFGRTDRYSFGEVLVSFTFEGGILAGIDYNHTQN